MAQRLDFDESRNRRRRPAALDAARGLAGELDDHPPYEELAAVVDGSADGVAREIVESHAAVCATCAAELADLRELAGGRAGARTRSLWWLAAAAAAAIVIVMLVQWDAHSPPAAVAPPHAVTVSAPPLPPEWRQLVADALRTGRVEIPAGIRALAADDAVRGTTAKAAPRVTVTPSATAIDDVQPRLRWSDAGADAYEPAIYEGDREIARGPRQRQTSWLCPRPLERGTTYRWQVIAVRGRQTSVIPAPPAPPAVFRVIDAKQHDELRRAAAEHPHNDLLLGVLSARAGLVDRAREHLARYAAATRSPAIDVR